MAEFAWIGPAQAVEKHRAALRTEGIELKAFAGAAAFLDAVPKGQATVVVVLAEWDGAVIAIDEVSAARADVSFAIASATAFPKTLTAVFDCAGCCLLDLRETDSALIADRLKRAGRRCERAGQEVNLLERLSSLNEDFLEKVLDLERRFADLEQELEQERQRAAGEQGETRILFVDDEPTICETFKILLGGRGHHVTSAPDGERALEIFGAESFELVIVDKNLPGMDGLEVIRRVKGQRPEVDAILITGYASKESAIEAVKLGASSYLEKPFDNLDLVADEIDLVIAQHRLQSSKRNYMQLFKARNQEFLEEYQKVRTDLEAWLYLKQG